MEFEAPQDRLFAQIRGRRSYFFAALTVHVLFLMGVFMVSFFALDTYFGRFAGPIYCSFALSVDILSIIAAETLSKRLLIASLICHSLWVVGDMALAALLLVLCTIDQTTAHVISAVYMLVVLLVHCISIYTLVRLATIVRNLALEEQLEAALRATAIIVGETHHHHHQHGYYSDGGGASYPHRSHSAHPHSQASKYQQEGGLSPREIEQYTKLLKYTPMAGTGAENCAICLCQLKEGETVRFLPCKHKFHGKGCIDIWLSESRVCPLCRRRVDKPDPLKV